MEQVAIFFQQYSGQQACFMLLGILVWEICCFYSPATLRAYRKLWKTSVKDRFTQISSGEKNPIAEPSMTTSLGGKDHAHGAFKQPVSPVIPVPQHNARFDSFVAAANVALESAYPKPPIGSAPRYSRVSVLLIRWAQDDLGTLSELEKLERVFHDGFGYDTYCYDIPEVDSQAKLTSTIFDFIKNADRDHLLIIYYGGHSDDSRLEHSLWRRCVRKRMLLFLLTLFAVIPTKALAWSTGA